VSVGGELHELVTLVMPAEADGWLPVVGVKASIAVDPPQGCTVVEAHFGSDVSNRAVLAVFDELAVPFCGQHASR